VRVFLSCVSREFFSYRLKLANQLGALRGHPFEVKIQEDFRQGGFTLLDQLAEYIRDCDLVIHLVGEACGAQPAPEHVEAMYKRLGIPTPSPLPERSYTQWEYDLAILFDRQVLCFMAELDSPRDCALPIAQSEKELALQWRHRERIDASGKHRERFANHAELIQRVFYDLQLEPDRKINNLPYKSLGQLFKGRDEFLGKLRAALGAAEHLGHQRAAAITASATAATVHGLGGIGKTRAALEYAHRYAHEYTALLFVQADSPDSLRQNLAALSGPLVLDLALKDVREIEAQVAAVLQWLQQHPGWFLILDNVDTEEAASAVQDVLAQLTRAGQVVITSRLSNWDSAVESLALDLLSPDAAAEFLLDRTNTARRKMRDDVAQAHHLAEELGQLSLALEQAAAYIVRYRLSFTAYLDEWQKGRERVLQWFHERTMQYPHSVAVTWQTSFERLSEPARQLLRLMSWMAPDPMPEKKVYSLPLTERAVPEDYRLLREVEELNRREAMDALMELADVSLVSRMDEAEFFTVHRLVQDVTRRAIPIDQRLPLLDKALKWMVGSFTRAPDSIQWPASSKPLAPHARVLVDLACAEPPLPKDRPLWLDEVYEDQLRHQHAATLLKCIADLLCEKGQFKEAEPICRRELEISGQYYGLQSMQTAVSTLLLAKILREMGQWMDAEELFLRTQDLLGSDAQVLFADAIGFNTANRIDYVDGKKVIGSSSMEEFEKHKSEYETFREVLLAMVAQEHALLLRDAGRPWEAVRLLWQALRYIEKPFPFMQVAHVKADLASALIDVNGDELLDEAEGLLQDSINLIENELDAGKHDAAFAIRCLGRIYARRSQWSMAENSLRTALEMDEKAYGTNHPRVLAGLDELGRYLKERGQLDESEKLLFRALILADELLDHDGYRYARLKPLVMSYVSLRDQIGAPWEETYSRLNSICEWYAGWAQMEREQALAGGKAELGPSSA